MVLVSHARTTSQNRITHSGGPNEDLPTTLKRRKLRWYGYHQDLSNNSYKEPCERIEGEEDRERDGRTTSQSGQEMR